MSDPKISVIMAAFNKSRYIKEAIESILSQTLRDFELIVVDDVSTDDTVAIVQSINDPRIVLLRNSENLGPAPTRNKAVAAARGEYLAIMDADDAALPERFRKEADFLDAHPDYGLVGSAFFIQDHLPGSARRLQKVLTEDRDIREGLKKQNWFGHSTVMIRRSVFNELGGYDPAFRYSHDYELMIRVAEKYKVANLAEPLCIWRSSPNNITNAKAAEQKRFAELAKASAGTRLSVKSRDPLITVKEPPLVSVIVPTFNRPALLGRTLESILHQTYPHFEIIVVNDAGAPVEGIVSSLNTSDHIMYLRHKKNAGLSAARNTGIRAARGSHIAYLDDDDFFYPDHLETIVTYLAGAGARAAYADSYLAVQRQINGVWETCERKLVFSVDFNRDLLFVQNLFPVLCMVHEKSLIDEVGGFDETLSTHEDWDLWIRLCGKDTPHHIKKVTSEYTRRDNAGGQMTTDPQSSFNETRKTIYAKYRSLIAHRPDILLAQEWMLASSDPESQRRIAQVDRFKGFLTDISTLVEKGDLEGALRRYDAARSEFPADLPEIAQVDVLMQRVRAMKPRVTA
jgi:O-antigen biosynthesis protein